MTETVVVVVGRMLRKDEQKGVALWSLSTSMTVTSVEHCCGVRFRVPMLLSGEANTAWAPSQSAAAIGRVVCMIEEKWKKFECNVCSVQQTKYDASESWLERVAARNESRFL